MPDIAADQGMADSVSRTALPSSDRAKTELKRLAEHCQRYRGADVRRSILQLATTFLLFCLSVAVMSAAFRAGAWWLYALLLLPAAGLLVRLFIIQHDCGHGSFFRSRQANDAAGRFMSLFTFIPYGLWRRAHNMHHAGSGNLDRRGAGDIDTLTVGEYQALPPFRKLLYRMYRHPLFILVLGPPIYILLLLRFPPLQSVPFASNYHPLPAREAWTSVLGLNLALLLFYGSGVAAIGWKAGLLAYLPVIVTAFWIGQWLFFIQHQFEEAYWQKQDKWNYNEAALAGSSFYVLPPVLQWFTGNIGFHHVHHLCPGIPNYRLQECFESCKDLGLAQRLTLRKSLKAIGLALWDEELGKMVRFGDLPAPGL